MPSKVWLLIVSLPYEGDEFCGVFSTEEKAKEAKKVCEDGASMKSLSFRVDWAELDEVTIP